LLLAWLTVAAGCSSGKKPPPAPPPAIALSVDHYVGTPLTGPRQQPPPATTTDAADVRVVVGLLAEVPRQVPGLQPIGTRAALLTATLGDRAVIASPRLAAESLVAEGDAAEALLSAARGGGLGPFAELTTLTGALPPQITAQFLAADPPGSMPPGRQVEVELFTPPQRGAAPTTSPATSPATAPGTAAAAPGAANAGIANTPASNVLLTLGVTDLADLPPPPSATTEPSADDVALKPKEKPTRRRRGSAAAPPPAPAVPRVMRQESILLKQPLAPATDGRVALVVPFRFSGSTAKAMLLVVQVRPGAAAEDAAAHAQATRRALANATKSGEAVAASSKLLPSALPPAADVRAGAFAVLARASDDSSRRAALLYLADRTDSPAAADVALVADGPTLVALSQAIGEGATKTDPKLAAADPGWLVDRTTLGLLSQRLSTETLSPELTAALVRRAGDLARRPDGLADLLKTATGTKDLDNRIEAENLIALEDSAPAARVRAYDYLASRGKAPAGYDPLGPARERRAALEKAMSAPATAPTTAPAPAAARAR
jgi:hypothetical protein